jgi:SAM-dependent methyltransferase
MMDEMARFNKERWEELAGARIAYSRPWLDLDPSTARSRVDPEGKMADPAGKDVLCLAGGGGQQSAAFAMLGANVTVFDLTDTMLERDREAAEHYGHEVRLIQGDMRDLSVFDDDSFDIIYHAHSLNFVPDVNPVFDEARRVLRPGGQYRMSCWNPFAWAVRDDEWDERGYPIRDPYINGEEWDRGVPNTWDVSGEDGTCSTILGPHEFRHILSTLVNGLIDRGFVIEGMWESDIVKPGEALPEPGSWGHFAKIMPTWLIFWTRLG